MDNAYNQDPLTHFDDDGRAKMVEVGEKRDTYRKAIASGKISMNSDTLIRIKEGRIHKGDVLGVAQVAGIMGAKKTSDFIPMCHPLMLTGIDLFFDYFDEGILIKAEVTLTGKTGVEMEALAAVSIAALTIYDMCKAMDRSMVISDIKLDYKAGGKSGTYIREDAINE